LTRSCVTVVSGCPPGCCRMFGAPGSAAAAGAAGAAGAGGAAARLRCAATCPAPAVVRARLGAIGSGRAAACPGDATRGLDARFGAVWCSSGMVTLISGRGIAPGVVGDALGVVEGADALPDGSTAGGPASAGLAGSAASAGFSSAGWLRPGVNHAAESNTPTASDDVNRDMLRTKSDLWRDAARAGDRHTSATDVCKKLQSAGGALARPIRLVMQAAADQPARAAPSGGPRW
jgi:hypothetical protein